VYYLLASCLLVFGRHRLDASFFKDFQDLEAKDFEQQQGASFIYSNVVLLCFTFVYMQLN
jgi:hypothetical protein